MNLPLGLHHCQGQAYPSRRPLYGQEWRAWPLSCPLDSLQLCPRLPRTARQEGVLQVGALPGHKSETMKFCCSRPVSQFYGSFPIRHWLDLLHQMWQFTEELLLPYKLLPDEMYSPSGFQMVTAVFVGVLSGAMGSRLPGAVSAVCLEKMVLLPLYLTRPSYCFNGKRPPKNRHVHWWFSPN